MGKNTGSIIVVEYKNLTRLPSWRKCINGCTVTDLNSKVFLNKDMGKISNKNVTEFMRHSKSQDF